MSTEAILQAIDDALATDPIDSPWIAPDEADRFTDTDPDFAWPYLRHLIQTIRECFLAWEDTPSLNPEPRTLTTNLLDWGKTYLPDHFQKPPSAMHQWMAQHLDAMPTDRGQKLNVLGPRGGAKSTLATLAYPLREALHAREPYIWIISDTAHQARAHLDNLKAELLDNELIAHAYPRAIGRGPVWRAEKIVLRNGVHHRSLRHRPAHPRPTRPSQPPHTPHLRRPPKRPPHGVDSTKKPHKNLVPRHVTKSRHTPNQHHQPRHGPSTAKPSPWNSPKPPAWQSKIFRSIDPWPFNTSLWEQWEQIYCGQHLPSAGTKTTSDPSAPSDPSGQHLPSAGTKTTSDSSAPNDPSGQHLPSAGTKTTSDSSAPSDPSGRHLPSAEHTTPDSPSPQTPTNQTAPNLKPLNPEPQQLVTDSGLPKNERPTGATHSDGAVAPTGRQPCCPRREARAFYEKHKTKMDAGAAVLWPQVEDLYTLMCLRAESGRPAFEREKQNSPLNPDLCEWPETYFTEDIWFDDWPAKTAAKVLALDPSKGGDAHRGDYSAFISLAVDRKGVLYVQADMARRPTPQMVADGVEIYRQFKPHVFGVEANQFQELLAPEFESAFCKQGLLGIHPWLIHNDANKRVRIRRLGPLLAARRIRLKANCPSTQLLLHQLQEFPIADHDDGPDAPRNGPPPRHRTPSLHPQRRPRKPPPRRITQTISCGTSQSLRRWAWSSTPPLPAHSS